MKVDLKELVSEFSGNLKLNYDLKKKNWFNIGGKVKGFFKADNLKELIKFLKKINNNEKIFVLGAGSNTLITDKKFDVILCLGSVNFGSRDKIISEVSRCVDLLADGGTMFFRVNPGLSHDKP